MHSETAKQVNAKEKLVAKTELQKAQNEKEKAKDEKARRIKNEQLLRNHLCKWLFDQAEKFLNQPDEQRQVHVDRRKNAKEGLDALRRMSNRRKAGPPGSAPLAWA